MKLLKRLKINEGVQSHASDKQMFTNAEFHGGRGTSSVRSRRFAVRCKSGIELHIPSHSSSGKVEREKKAEVMVSQENKPFPESNTAMV